MRVGSHAGFLFNPNGTSDLLLASNGLLLSTVVACVTRQYAIQVSNSTPPALFERLMEQVNKTLNARGFYIDQERF